MKLTRLKQLAGMHETVIQVEDPDEEDRRWEEQQKREQHVVRAIFVVFQKIGLDIADNEHEDTPNITYFEDSGRAASVVLSDNIVDVDKLIKLKQSGLSSKYEVHAGSNFQLQIEFVVSQDIDKALLP